MANMPRLKRYGQAGKAAAATANPFGSSSSALRSGSGGSTKRRSIARPKGKKR